MPRLAPIGASTGLLIEPLHKKCELAATAKFVTWCYTGFDHAFLNTLFTKQYRPQSAIPARSRLHPPPVVRRIVT